jgi:hypothetical protein
MAELIGLTYQQAYKDEKGLNRVAAGRLYRRACGYETYAATSSVVSSAIFVRSNCSAIFIPP